VVDFEGAVLATVADALPDGGFLFAGSSMPVRDLDAFAGPRDREILATGNRGASGIDGSVSTALGAAAATGRPAVAVLGDLALHHDMNGLRDAGRHGLDVVFVVIHNDGGGIFHFLPVREHEHAFERFFGTPHGLEFRPAAEMYGLEHRRVEPGGVRTVRDALETALEEALDAGGPWLLEVPSDREGNRRRRGAVVEAAARAAEEALADGR
jgi:2-succinyl-5-enolpyruvyl-6-hydroxy-3-cyclohexene-1-carboxylate synthase